MIWLFLALAALDLITTWIGIRKGLTESNPVLRALMASPFWVPVKIAASIAAALLSPPWVLGLLSALYSVVLLRNIRLIRGVS